MNADTILNMWDFYFAVLGILVEFLAFALIAGGLMITIGYLLGKIKDLRHLY